MLANILETSRRAAVLLSEVSSAIQKHNYNHSVSFQIYCINASLSTTRVALPEHHTALSNRRDIIELRSEFESHLATLGLEIVATTENLSSEEDEYDNENQLNPAETPEGSEARIEIVDPVRFLGVLPQLIDAATSAPCLAATLARIAENLRLQLEDKERPSTTSLLRQKLQPCGFELLSQFQRLAVSKEELRKIAQHCLHER